MKHIFIYDLIQSVCQTVAPNGEMFMSGGLAHSIVLGLELQESSDMDIYTTGDVSPSQLSRIITLIKHLLPKVNLDSHPHISDIRVLEVSSTNIRTNIEIRIENSDPLLTRVIVLQFMHKVFTNLCNPLVAFDFNAVKVLLRLKDMTFYGTSEVRLIPPPSHHTL